MTVRRRVWVDSKGRHRTAWQADAAETMADGKVVRERKTSDKWTKREAERWERKARARILAGIHRKEKQKPPTLAKFRKEFVDNYAKKNNKPSVVAEKERILDQHLIPALGSKRLDAITTKDVEQWKAEQKCAPKTLNNRLAVLSRVLTVAAEWGYLNARDLPRVKTVQVPDNEIDALGWDDEVPALLEAAKRYPMLSELCTLLVYTGLRIGEAKSLQWGDIAGGQLTVRRNVWYGKKGKPHVGSPKGGRSRVVPLNEEAQAALTRLPKRGLWVFSKDGNILSVAALEKPLRTTCKAIKLRTIGWHTLRHTFGSRLAQTGTGVRVIKDLMGHQSIKVTMRYIHAAPGAHTEAVQKLSKSWPIHGTWEKAE